VAVDDFNPADLDELTAAIKGADPTGELIRSASLNPDEVQVPGVWVRFDGLAYDVLAGLTVKLTLHLIVPNAGGFARVLGKLAELHNLVKPVVAGYGGPSGNTTRTGVLLPGNSSNPMPALAIPLDLLTDQEE
jgi:hypothetical protein